MKTVLFIFLFGSVAHGGLISPFGSTVDGVSVPNAHDISKSGNLKIVRGQRPYVDGSRNFDRDDHWSEISSESRGFMEELFSPRIGLEEPFTDVLIFKAGGDKEISGQLEVLAKIEEETGHAVKVKKIEFPWKDFDDYVKACEDTIEGLQLMKEVNESVDRSLYFHCTVGEDRTGYLAGLWRVLNQGWSRWKAFDEEMCARGYGAGNPKKPFKVYKEVREDLTPLYLKMVELVRAGEISYQNLDKAVCDHFKGFENKGYDIRHYECEAARP